VYVGSLTKEVLRVALASDDAVQALAAVTAGDDDTAEAPPEGFQDGEAESAQALYSLRAWGVVDAVPDGGTGASHFQKREMLGELNVLCVFHSIYRFISFTVAKVLQKPSRSKYYKYLLWY